MQGQQNYIMDNNRRSTKKIIDVLNHVRGDDSLKQGCYRNTEGNEVCVIVCNNVTDIISKYNEKRKQLGLNGSSCIITQRNDSVTKLKTCSNNCNYTVWSDLYEADSADRQRFLYRLLTAQEYAANSRYETAVKEIIKIFRTDREGNLKEPFKSFTITEKIFKRSYAISLLEYLINNYSTNMDKTLLVFYNDLNRFLTTIGLSLKKIGKGAFKDMSEALLIKDLVNSLKLKEEKTSNIRTIHKAKGAEFESVLVYIEDSRDIANIITSNIDSDEDDCRLYYVALSRAEDFLCIAVEDLTTDQRKALEQLNIRVIS